MNHEPFVVSHGTVRHERVTLDHPVKAAFGVMRERHAVLLSLQSSGGETGIGESWVNFPQWAPWERVAAYEQVIIPWLIGREIISVSQTVQELYEALVGPARQSGTIPALVQALCGLEIALWDLAARQLSKPLAELWFSQPHRKIQVYASGLNSPIPWPLIDEHLDNGVTLFKLKLGFGAEEDRRNIVALKRHLGQNARLAVDVNRGWRWDQAQAWIPFLAEQEIVWLEEPLRLDEEDRLAELRQLSDVPLAGGENALMPPGCALTGLSELPADILQPDITKYTPPHIALALLQSGPLVAERVVPHFLGSGPGQAASIQLAAGCGPGLVEFDLNRNPLRTESCQEPFVIEAGHIILPERPGLGWSLKTA